MKQKDLEQIMQNSNLIMSLCLKKNDPEYNWFKKVSLTDKNHIESKKFL
jgi:hypothetical protein